MILSVEDIITDMEAQLSDLHIRENIYRQLRHNFKTIDLVPLQLFYLWASARGHTSL